jgi:hypothetical protein
VPRIGAINLKLKESKMNNQNRNKTIRSQRAANTIGRKMSKDNLPHSKAMQKKKKKSSALTNMLLRPKK